MEQPPTTPALDGAILRSADEWRAELAAVFSACYEAARRVGGANTAHNLVAHQAEWHMRGVLHHMQRMLDAYSSFARGVTARAEADAKLDVLVMHAPSLKEVLFEFYALVNLSRIALDNLRLFLRPVFRTDFRQLPKSI